MPITFNEPLSFLQRLAEYMEYSYLLQLASNSEDPVERQEVRTSHDIQHRLCTLIIIEVHAMYSTRKHLTQLLEQWFPTGGMGAPWGMRAVAKGMKRK